MRYQLGQPSFGPDDLAWYNGQGDAVVRGLVTASPRRTAHIAQVSLEAESISWLTGADEPAAISGEVLIWQPRDTWLRYGDLVEVRGELVTPADASNFSYLDYLAKQDIHSLMVFPGVRLIAHQQGNPLVGWLISLREKANQTIQEIFPMPESALLAGILVGMREDIPEYLYQAYQVTATAHIIVISGFNISVLAMLCTRFFRRWLPWGWNALAAAIVILAYTIFVGAQPPVVRAAIMGSLALPAYLIGMRLIGVHTLAVTAALMLLFKPVLVSDVSFQLSFLATLGMLVFSDPAQHLLLSLINHFNHQAQPNSQAGILVEYLCVTLAAQFATLPVILYQFEYLSLLALPANLLILPVQPPLMLLGGLATLLGIAYLPLGRLAGALVWLPAAYCNRTALLLGSISNTLLNPPRYSFWATIVLLVVLLIPAARFQFSRRIEPV